MRHTCGTKRGCHQGRRVGAGRPHRRGLGGSGTSKIGAQAHKGEAAALRCQQAVQRLDAAHQAHRGRRSAWRHQPGSTDVQSDESGRSDFTNNRTPLQTARGQQTKEGGGGWLEARAGPRQEGRGRYGAKAQGGHVQSTGREAGDDDGAHDDARRPDAFGGARCSHGSCCDADDESFHDATASTAVHGTCATAGSCCCSCNVTTRFGRVGTSATSGSSRSQLCCIVAAIWIGSEHPATHDVRHGHAFRGWHDDANGTAAAIHDVADDADVDASNAAAVDESSSSGTTTGSIHASHGRLHVRSSSRSCPKHRAATQRVRSPHDEHRCGYCWPARGQVGR
mmetsp:Transcript_20063/g.56881  ORF Transcript_20063/g.56881 Transcript_20063/m.56881 type:complete len:338 (+) Transcript_20063:259-1272(+)